MCFLMFFFFYIPFFNTCNSISPFDSCTFFVVVVQSLTERKIFNEEKIISRCDRCNFISVILLYSRAVVVMHFLTLSVVYRWRLSIRVCVVSDAPWHIPLKCWNMGFDMHWITLMVSHVQMIVSRNSFQQTIKLQKNTLIWSPLTRSLMIFFCLHLPRVFASCLPCASNTTNIAGKNKREGGLRLVSWSDYHLSKLPLHSSFCLHFAHVLRVSFQFSVSFNLLFLL